jgi:protein arginine N-methyltransferase 1
MSRQLDDHRQFLDDRCRVEAFDAAIRSAVRPGDVVIDLGCGTGIFGLLACRAGAARVYAIDQSEMAELARALAAANGFGDRVVVVRDFSMTATLPERADLVVSDQIGHFGWEAGVLEFCRDAAARLLKPGGRIIPRRVHLWLAPIESATAWRAMSFWQTRPFGFDMSPAQRIAWNSGYPRQIDAAALLAEGQLAASLDPAHDNDHFTARADLVVRRAGILHAVAGWFSADLDDRVSITNAPDAADRIQRRQALFPVCGAPAVQPGQFVCVSMSIRPRDLLVKWTVELWPDHASVRAGGEPLARYTGCTFDGMPFSPDDLRRARPSFLPRLTPRGEARRLVVDLMDGAHTVAEIEAAVRDGYAALFHSDADAAAFVAEVVSRYSE